MPALPAATSDALHPNVCGFTVDEVAGMVGLSPADVLSRLRDLCRTDPPDRGAAGRATGRPLSGQARAELERAFRGFPRPVG
jgi:hypothetical protein